MQTLNEYAYLMDTANPALSSLILVNNLKEVHVPHYKTDVYYTQKSITTKDSLQRQEDSEIFKVLNTADQYKLYHYIKRTDSSDNFELKAIPIIKKTKCPENCLNQEIAEYETKKTLIAAIEQNVSYAFFKMLETVYSPYSILSEQIIHRSILNCNVIEAAKSFLMSANQIPNTIFIAPYNISYINNDHWFDVEINPKKNEYERIYGYLRSVPIKFNNNCPRKDIYIVAKELGYIYYEKSNLDMELLDDLDVDSKIRIYKSKDGELVAATNIFMLIHTKSKISRISIL